MHLLHLLVLVIHAVLSAALLGGMVYSFITVQPRAKLYFKDIRDFEAFVANLAHGARWKFLTILSLIAITGLAHPLLSESAGLCFGGFASVSNASFGQRFLAVLFMSPGGFGPVEYSQGRQTCLLSAEISP
jgi:hypothetical protein